MHDIKWIRDNSAAFDDAMKRRGKLSEFNASELIALDDARRGAITAFEQAQARRNAASKEIGDAKKAKDEARAASADGRSRRAEGAAAEAGGGREGADAANWTSVSRKFPTCPSPEVPDGADEHGNVEHHHFGAKRDYAFKPKEHVELGEGLGFMDFEAAAKLSGARFTVLKSGLARMERALAQFMLDTHTDKHDYTEVAPPLLVRDDAMFGTAQLPKFEEDDQFFLGL